MSDLDKEKLFEKSTENLFKPSDLNNLNKVSVEFVERIFILIVAGLGLITVLAWDDVLKDLFDIIFGSANGIYEKVFYALLLTFITTIVTWKFNKLSKKVK